MQTAELAVWAMLPRVLQARFFTASRQLLSEQGRVSDCYEVSFYTEGTGTIRIGDSTYPIRGGDIRFTPPGTRLFSVPDYKCCTVYFDFGESGVVYKNALLEGLPGFFHTNGELLPLFERIIKTSQSPESFAVVRLNALVLELLAAMFEQTHSDRAYSPVVSICIAYLREHFRENITLETLGTVSGYSGLHILRLFERETGQSPHKWLTAIRINHARYLLTDTDRSIEDIAQTCGFRSVSHFKILFRETTQLTPGAYRKNARQI